MKTTMKNFAAVLALSCFVASGAAQADNFECKITEVYEVHRIQEKITLLFLCGKKSPQESPCSGKLSLNRAEFTMLENNWDNNNFQPRPAYTGYIYFDTGNGIMGFNNERCELAMPGETSCKVLGAISCDLKSKKTWGNVR